MVLKIRPDRSVQLSAGHGSSPVWPIRPESDRTRIGLFELIVWPTNRMNRLVRIGRSNSFSFSFPRAASISIVAWSVVLLATVPPLLPGASSCRQHPLTLETLPRVEKPSHMAPKMLQIPSSRRQHPFGTRNPAFFLPRAGKPPHPLASLIGNLPTLPPKRCKSPSPTPRLQSLVTFHPRWRTGKLSPTPKEPCLPFFVFKNLILMFYI